MLVAFKEDGMGILLLFHSFNNIVYKIDEFINEELNCFIKTNNLSIEKGNYKVFCFRRIIKAMATTVAYFD